jgi:hypothetical protein
MRITQRDVIALALGAGIKVGGGDLQKAFTYALIARFAMKWLNFPQGCEAPISLGAQQLVQDAAGVFRQATGQVPFTPYGQQVATSDTPYPPGTQGQQTPPAGGDIVDGDYTTGN